MSYTIRPFLTAAMPGVDKGVIHTYLTDHGVEFNGAMISYLITSDNPDDDFVAVVDTGVDLDQVERSGRKLTQGGGEQPFIDFLKEEGYEPADVDYVILTHLHYDHAGNNALFPNAEILVQRAEWEAAQNPLPTMERVYYQETLDELEDLDLTLLDGGFRLREGLELMLTPGHTQGLQTVLIETETVPHAIISDLAYCRHNIEPGIDSMEDINGNDVEVTPMDVDYIPPGLHVSVEECFESIARIRERVEEDGVLLTCHAPSDLHSVYPE
jgi:glyoxylase-like metal-dependent hydrolase (beta-lactamase superfamily II)